MHTQKLVTHTGISNFIMLIVAIFSNDGHKSSEQLGGRFYLRIKVMSCVRSENGNRSTKKNKANTNKQKF